MHIGHVANNRNYNSARRLRKHWAVYLITCGIKARRLCFDEK